MVARLFKRKMLGVIAACTLTLGLPLVSVQAESAAGVPAVGAVALQANGLQLNVVKAGGESIPFRVELALTREAQARSLMFREHLDDDVGMLFVFDETRQASFWMRNTLIPLDLIFVRENGKIANIIHSAEPETETLRLSKGRVRAVFEIAGGRAKALGIKAGDLIEHPLLGTVQK